MIFLSVLQYLTLFLVVRQAQAQVTPRGFKFNSGGKGRGGCSAEDVAIILKELEIAKEAAEAAARDLTSYPYYYAFQSPNHPYFQGKNLAQAARTMYSRIALMADRFHLDHKFRIECRSELCADEDGDITALTKESIIHAILPPMLWLKRPADPVMAFCEPFFKTEDLGSRKSVVSTELRLQQFKEVLNEAKKNPGAGVDSVNMDNVAFMRSQVVLHELAHTAYASRPII
ncbi:hypothetical protein CSHISOI_10057 [Colletotrichum shisoi]|uniref:Lysine-specific metallo-endopeptidase domain-containing protein n=1 Tax=Colletotrichum shisoi TaxID=2078593 RepID=A0A5Q4BF37_9PEZI|nr:hypothetical protein CSHISOI_10057 [Colletotrichum shisoi]